MRAFTHTKGKKMKKRVLYVLMAILVAVSSRMVYAAKMPVKPNQTPIDPVVMAKRSPDYISQMDEIPMWELDKPFEMDLSGGWSYSCVDLQDYHATRIYGAGFCFIVVGRFYYNPDEELFIPFDEDAWTVSICLEPTNEGLKVYGSIDGTADGIIPAEPILDGNTCAEVYYERVYFGWDDSDWYDVSVVIPDAFQGTYPDSWIVLKDPFGYLPGQNGDEFYLNFERVSVTYYRYGADLYTRIQTERDKNLLVRGIFLYDASHFRMYSKNTAITIKYDRKAQHFIANAGGVSWAQNGYFQEENSFILGDNAIDIAYDCNLPQIRLSNIEGIPLIIW